MAFVMPFAPGGGLEDVVVNMLGSACGSNLNGVQGMPSRLLIAASLFEPAIPRATLSYPLELMLAH